MKVMEVEDERTYEPSNYFETEDGLLWLISAVRPVNEDAIESEVDCIELGPP